MNFIPPYFKQDWFTCPHCNVYSKQDWQQSYWEKNWCIYIAICQHCNEISIWFSKNIFFNHRYQASTADMVYPIESNIPLYNEDLNEEIILDYLEARIIVNNSPRWACALLRLALQKLMIQVWEDSDINKSIWNLVKKWLNTTIQRALDSVRVIWNEAVHPWELDLKDDIETATKMFWLINIIADALITQPRRIEELYFQLPEWKLEWIENRDRDV
jgi:hypothetical protein